MKLEEHIMPLREAERKKQRLMKLLRESQQNKAALVKVLEGLYQQHEEGILSTESYNIRRDALLGTRTVKEWEDSYNAHSKELVSGIEYLNEEIRTLKEERERRPLTPTISYLVLAAVVIMFGFFLFKPAFIGFITFENITNATDEINITFNNSMNYTFTPSPGGELTSLRISGISSVEGFAVVSIINNNISYVIFNSSEIETTFITDYVTFGQEVDNIAISEAIIIEEGNLNISMEYKSGTEYDPEDDGRESTGGFIDYTIENTTIDLNESNLCTVWDINEEYKECYGSGLCCDFIGTERYNENWKNPFLVYYGLEGTELNNNISSQVWYVDYNLSTENPYSFIYYSDKMQLPAAFAMRGYIFENVCVDTCLISGQGFDKHNYTLSIEMENAQLEISIIDYNISPKELIVNETLIQHTAEINKPVKWTKKIDSEIARTDIVTKISGLAENITVFKKVDSTKEKIKKLKSKKIEKNKTFNIYAKEKDKLLNKIKKQEDRLKKATRSGRIERLENTLARLKLDLVDLEKLAGVEYEPEYETEIEILEEAQAVEIEYYTPAPKVFETNLSPRSKQIIVSSEEHYTDIFTYTSLPTEAEPEFVHLYWIINRTRIEIFNVTKNDTNNNGLIDWIEWIIPHLSNQTFIVEIRAVGEYNFTDGVFNQTETDGENITLNLTNGDYYDNGYYISPVIDAGSIATWTNITWNETVPYGEELPDNKAIENVMGGADMTDNVLLMHMNDGSGSITDSSGEGNNGAESGGISYELDGRLDKGLGFDGVDDFVNISNDAGLDLSTISIGFWFKPADDYDSGTSDVSFVRRNNYEVYIENGRMMFNYSGTIISSSNNSWSKDNWYYVLAVYQSSRISIYINGVEENSTTIDAPFIIQNSDEENVAAFYNSGDIVINGTCSAGSCSYPGDDTFVIQDNSSDTVAYIDRAGNLCIEDSDCNDNDANCENPTDGSFIIKDSDDTIVSYINSTGGFCLIGNLIENGNP